MNALKNLFRICSSRRFQIGVNTPSLLKFILVFSVVLVGSIWATDSKLWGTDAKVLATTFISGNLADSSHRLTAQQNQQLTQLQADTKAASKISSSLLNMMNLSDVTQVTVGWRHTCALLGNKRIKCWGDNSYGQLGNGSTDDSATPEDVADLSDIVYIAAGDSHTCAIDGNNGVWCWGRNVAGQIGDGTFDHRSTPVAVKEIDNATKIIAAGWISCALLTTKEIKCWGNNDHYTMADGTQTDRPTPILIDGIDDAIELAAGGGHVCAVLSTGRVACWGDSSKGQQGDGSKDTNFVPTTIDGLSGVTAIDAGRSHTCVLSESKSVSCWGSNGGMQIGDGTTNDRLTPYTLIMEKESIAVAAGSFFLSNDYLGHSCVLHSDATASCWGSNRAGQLGDGTTTNRANPVTVSDLSDVEQLIIGVENSCALISDGGLQCWGDNAHDQLGHGQDFRRPNYVGDPSCYSLNLSVIGSGELLLDPSESASSCANTAQYAPGESIKLRAVPDSGWSINSWSGIPVVDGSTGYDLAMPSYNLAVSVEFLMVDRDTPTPPADTPIPPTDTPIPPTETPLPPTDTPIPPTDTPVPPTDTPIPPTDTPVPPTDTPIPSTNTPVPPTETATPVTDTPIPPTATPQPPDCFTLTTSNTGQGNALKTLPPKSIGCPDGQYKEGEPITVLAAPENGWQVGSWSGTSDDGSTATTNELSMPSVAHSVAVTYVESSSSGDSYEDDNSCGAARFLPPDGSVQSHTFHRQADLDWVYFNAEAGVTYRIEVSTDIDSLADVNLELYSDCEELAEENEDPSFNPGIRLDFESPEDGPIYLRLANYDATLFGEQAAYEISIRALADDGDNKALIIVAGRFRGTDRLQTNIDEIASSVYRLFQKNDYSDEDIYFLATDTRLPGYDAAATQNALRAAITDWAADRLSENGVLTIYMVDHGSPNLFYIDEVSGQRVSPTELDEWLTTLETEVPGVTSNIFIEACQSGSFIDMDGGSISKPGRVVITSTDAVNDAKASRDGAYFSDHFLTALHQGDTLASSFDRARKVAATAFSLQQSWLDADGDGIANEFEDAAVSARRSFADIGTLSTNQWAPHIFSVVEPDEITNFSGTIQVDVRDDLKVSEVWAVVYPPDYVAPENVQELQAETLPSFNLTPTGDEDLFAGIYPGFTQTGIYRIVIHAADNDKLVATPREIKVFVDNETPLSEQDLYLPFVTR